MKSLAPVLMNRTTVCCRPCPWDIRCVLNGKQNLCLIFCCVFKSFDSLPFTMYDWFIISIIKKCQLSRWLTSPPETRFFERISMLEGDRSVTSRTAV